MHRDTDAISIDGITKTFPIPFRRTALLAVDSLSLRVREGEVYGLLGPNGSGKSTTLKIALGLVRPDKGSSALFGQSSDAVSSREAVGFLPENPYFQKFLTGAETLRFFGRLCGLSGRGLEERVRELLALVGLENASDRRLGGYSKGMLQRIGLAQSLVQSPRLVILDEPTAGVDPAGARQIKDLILGLKREGITVLLCSHLLSQVQEVCDRIGIMNKGGLVREGSLDELITRPEQLEVRFDKIPEGFTQRIREFASGLGAEIVSAGSPRTTLEEFFLEVTGGSTTSQTPGK